MTINHRSDQVTLTVEEFDKSYPTLKEDAAAFIERMADQVWNFMQEDIENTSMDVTNTCLEFEEGTCTQCFNEEQMIEDRLRTYILDAIKEMES